LNREEWLQERTKGIGGSDISAIVGMNPYRGAMDVWLDKTGRGQPIRDNADMQRGRLLEPVIGQLYAERFGRVVHPQGNDLRVDPDNPIFRATADFLIEGESRGLECKAPRKKQLPRYGPEESGKFPEEYLCQCLWYLGVYRLNFWDLAAWIGAEDLRVYEIPRNQPLIDSLRERAERFWTDNVLADRPPEIDSSPAWASYLADMYPQGAGEFIQATEEAAQVALHLRGVLLEAEALEAKKTFLENKMRALIGEAKGVYGPGWKVTWVSRAGRKTTKWEAVLATIAREFGIPASRLEELVREHTEQGKPSRALMTADLKKWEVE
jgi:putative phage-type endonuclease